MAPHRNKESCSPRTALPLDTDSGSTPGMEWGHNGMEWRHDGMEWRHEGGIGTGMDTYVIYQKNGTVHKR